MKPVPRSQSGPAPLWWVALALVLALTLTSAVALWHLRRDAIDGQARELGLLALALTDEVERGLQGANEGFGAIRAELRDSRLPIRGTGANLALRTRADLMPLVSKLWLIDRDGRPLSSSDATPIPDPESFLPPLNSLPDDATAVSRPFTDPATKESLVAMAVTFRTAHDTESGWILAAVPAKDLLGAFSVASPAADARMAVFRSDGARLAGSIVTSPTLDEAGIAERLAQLPPVEVREASNGQEYLVTLHSLPNYGLSVVMTRNLSEVLVEWRRAAQLTSGAMALLLSILVISVYFVQRADRRRNEAQHALQAQLTRASKLESLGTLAGGVAHDFNNVLAAIIGFGEMAQDEASPGSDQARYLDKVLQAGLRGRSLVERVLTFSRGGARAAIVFELEPIVDEVLAMLAASLRPGVVLERDLDATGVRLRGDPTQAFEAVMNLCTNAMQAMPDGGMVSVKVERHRNASLRVLSHSQLTKGDYVALTVADQGTGIAPDVMEHLFEPFFTTRGATAGTGLGLAVVHGVVALFGGAIDVQSTPGNGARFTVYLPVSNDPVVPSGSAPTLAPRGAGQSLLIVDDEPALVELAEEMLKGIGYDPVGYTNPAEALTAVTKAPERFSVVITDEVMPGISGTRLTESLRRQGIHVPILLVSGYGGALLASRANAAGVTRVLAKPLQRAELARALAELLQ